MTKPFFSQTPQQALQSLSASPQGLSAAQAEDRLREHGPNQLHEGKKKSAAAVFFEQFKDLLVVILIAAAVISMLSGNAESTAVIFAVLLLNAALGTVQYFKAEKSLASLKAMASPSAKVLRGGTACTWRYPAAGGGRPRSCRRAHFGKLFTESERKFADRGKRKRRKDGRCSRGGKHRPGRPEKHGIFRFACYLWARLCAYHCHRHAY